MSNIFEQLNKQLSFKNAICLETVKTEKQRKKLNKQGYAFDYTCQTWEKMYPSIPAKYIYCLKTCLYPEDLIYADFEHYIIFHTRLYSKNFILTNRENFESNANKQINELMERYKKKEYRSLLLPILSEQSGRLVMEMLAKMLEKEPPSPELYDTFIAEYSFVDCGADIFDIDHMKMVIACKSNKQKDRTQTSLAEFPDEITIYRGEGNASTPWNKAFSWTTDINTAYIFSCWRDGSASRIIKATVNKKDIIEYITDRDESEILILPSTVKNPEIEELTTLDEFLSILRRINGFNDEETRNFEEYSPYNLIQWASEVYDQRKDNKDHDYTHTCRVLLFASYLFKVLFLSRPTKKLFAYYETLTNAALYHDVGRINEERDVSHGAAGYKVYVSENKPDELVEFLITNHCIDDQVALQTLESSNLPNKEMAKQLLFILKDADALDRWRFSNEKDRLDVNYLRLPESKKLVAVAKELQNYKFE